MKQGIINTDRRFYFRLAFFSCPLNSPLSHVFLVYRDVVVIDDVYNKSKTIHLILRMIYFSVI